MYPQQRRFRWGRAGFLACWIVPLASFWGVVIAAAIHYF